MKLLTVIVASDMQEEISELIAEMEIDCYVRIGESYGVSHRCTGSIGNDLPWEASVLLIAGTEEHLVRLAENIEQLTQSKEYKPCLRMMLQPLDKVWMY